MSLERKMAMTQVSRKEMRKYKRKKRKGLKIFLIIFGLFLLVAGSYVYHLYSKLDETVSGMYTPLESDKEKKEEIDQRLSEKEPINVLLLGVDAREGDRGRSDTMIFMSLNPKTDQILMLSIPRDTYVNIPGRGMDKINHAYAFGDVELSVQTFEEAFNLPVHYYARVNMEGFKQGVDALGGITIQDRKSTRMNSSHVAI